MSWIVMIVSLSCKSGNVHIKLLLIETYRQTRWWIVWFFTVQITSLELREFHKKMLFNGSDYGIMVNKLRCYMKQTAHTNAKLVARSLSPSKHIAFTVQFSVFLLVFFFCNTFEFLMFFFSLWNFLLKSSWNSPANISYMNYKAQSKVSILFSTLLANHSDRSLVLYQQQNWFLQNSSSSSTNEKEGTKMEKKKILLVHSCVIICSARYIIFHEIQTAKHITFDWLRDENHSTSKNNNNNNDRDSLSSMEKSLDDVNDMPNHKTLSAIRHVRLAWALLFN